MWEVIKMLINLVKKDLLLAKKYLIIMFIFAIAAPIYVQLNSGGGLASFFVTVIMVQYMLVNTVSFAEDKSKGSVLLCTTPYTRDYLVKARYLFILLVFACCYIIYTLTAFISPIHLEMLGIHALGISFLATAICFGLMLPFQYRFGYKTTRYIFFFIIFISLFTFPALAKSVHINTIFQITVPFSQGIQDILPWIIALVIGYISMLVSLHIYSHKDF
jgi:hypothetical protein